MLLIRNAGFTEWSTLKDLHDVLAPNYWNLDFECESKRDSLVASPSINHKGEYSGLELNFSGTDNSIILYQDIDIKDFRDQFEIEAEIDVCAVNSGHANIELITVSICTYDANGNPDIKNPVISIVGSEKLSQSSKKFYSKVRLTLKNKNKNLCLVTIFHGGSGFIKINSLSLKQEKKHHQETFYNTKNFESHLLPSNKNVKNELNKEKILIVAWDLGHNPAGRAFLLAEMLSRSYDVELLRIILSRTSLYFLVNALFNC